MSQSETKRIKIEKVDWGKGGGGGGNGGRNTYFLGLECRRLGVFYLLKEKGS